MHKHSYLYIYTVKSKINFVPEDIKLEVLHKQKDFN